MAAISCTLPKRIQASFCCTVPYRLFSLAKAVTHFVLSCLARIISFLICHSSRPLTAFVAAQQQKKEAAWRAFRGISSPSVSVKSTTKKLAPPPVIALPAQDLTAEQRENRIREPHDIPHRLNRERVAAEAQMNTEPEKLFKYKETPTNFVFTETRQGTGVGVASHIGGRQYFEDRHLAHSFVIRHADRDYPVQAFGVFDGHGGGVAAEFVRDQFVQKFTALLGRFGLEEAGIWNALKLTFVELNQEFKQAHPNARLGTTACMAILLNNQLWCANVGDSRAVLIHNGRATQLSDDAKPGDPKYQAGIEHRGGRVMDGRINWELAVARAIGDHHVRGVSARPKIMKIPLADVASGGHLILGSDGFWDVTSSRQAARAVRRNPILPGQEEKAAQNFVYSAGQVGSTDNTTVMVVTI